MSWGAVGAAVAGAATLGGISYGSAKQQATMSKQQARENRAFQERMSSTAYQRAADDLEAAGLNRILALGSPASTPGGSVAQFPAMGAVGQAAAMGASAGTSAYQSYTQARTADANIELMGQQTALTQQNVANAMVQNGILTEKQMQEVAKTPLYQKVIQFASEVMDIVQDSPQGWADLKEYLESGEVWEGLRYAAKGVAGDIKQMAFEIAKEIFKNSPAGWLTGKIKNAILGGSNDQ